MLKYVTLSHTSSVALYVVHWSYRSHTSHAVPHIPHASHASHITRCFNGRGHMTNDCWHLESQVNRFSIEVHDQTGVDDSDNYSDSKKNKYDHSTSRRSTHRRSIYKCNCKITRCSIQRNSKSNDNNSRRSIHRRSISKCNPNFTRGSINREIAMTACNKAHQPMQLLATACVLQEWKKLYIVYFWTMYT